MAGRDKDWLLRLENLSLVRDCRRLVQREFGIPLPLDADDLLERILAYGGRSAQPRLRRQARLLGYRLRCAARSHGFELAHVPVVAPRGKTLNRDGARNRTTKPPEAQ